MLVTVTTITHPEKELIFMFARIVDKMGYSYSIDNITGTWKIEVMGGCPEKWTETFLDVISLYTYSK